jgi:hypothetical protein
VVDVFRNNHIDKMNTVLDFIKIRLHSVMAVAYFDFLTVFTVDVVGLILNRVFTILQGLLAG